MSRASALALQGLDIIPQPGEEEVPTPAELLRGYVLRCRPVAGGLTNTRVRLTVTDMRTGTSKQYNNPQGAAFQPIQDTGAFVTCL